MKFVILILGLALIGCATEGKFRTVLDSWLGSDEDKLVSSWGPPDQTYTLPSGSKLLTYNTVNGMSSHPMTGFNGQYMGSMIVSHYCKTTFKLSSDITHKIESYQYEGNNCRSK